MVKRNHSHMLYFGNTRCVLTKYFVTSACQLPKCDNSSISCSCCCHCTPFVVFDDSVFSNLDY